MNLSFDTAIGELIDDLGSRATDKRVQVGRANQKASLSKSIDQVAHLLGTFANQEKIILKRQGLGSGAWSSKRNGVVTAYLAQGARRSWATE